MKKVIAVLMMILILFPTTFPLTAAAISEDSAETAGSPEQEAAADATAAFTLPCRGAILIEQTTGRVLYESNADEPMPIASVTKVMTLLLVMEALDAGTLSLDENVPISELAASMGGSQVFLEVGEEISLNDVLKAVFVSSANDGAVALAELVSGTMEGFVARMNERAAELGMTSAVFYNPTGLDDQETNLCSARDVAIMSRELLSHEKVYDYTKIWIDSIRGGAFGLSNTNKLVRFYPGATGLKTGSTGKAKYCVSASAERGNLKLCAVVLAGETSADRFQAAKTMLDYGFANYAYYVPEAYQEVSIPVWGGTAASVGTEATGAGLLLAKSDATGLTSRIEIAEELNAPVEKGQVVGKILYEKGGAVIQEVPITAKEAVPKLNFWGIFRQLLRVVLFSNPQRDAASHPTA